MTLVIQVAKVTLAIPVHRVILVHKVILAVKATAAHRDTPVAKAT